MQGDPFGGELKEKVRRPVQSRATNSGRITHTVLAGMRLRPEQYLRGRAQAAGEKQRGGTRVEVAVVAAKNIPPAPNGDHCNPYCVVRFRGMILHSVPFRNRPC